MISNLSSADWINLYIYWELTLIKELGFEINILDKNKLNDTLVINNKTFRIPKLYQNELYKNICKNDIVEALIFNKCLILENFILPNKLKFPLFRDMLENYYS